MTERHALTIKPSADIHDDWSTLIARAADDVSRIVRSELHLFETSLRPALKAQINYALAGFALVTVMACGMLCALAASILYAHQWLPWWESCAVGAFIMFLTAAVIRAIGFATPSKIISTSLLDPKAFTLAAPASGDKQTIESSTAVK